MIARTGTSKGLPPTAHLLWVAGKADGRLKLVKAIAAAGVVREFGEAKPWQVQEQLGPWVQELCHAQRRRIEPQAVQALLEATGADRWKIQREVEKLASACPEGERITTGRIGHFNKGAFHLATALRAPIVPLFIRIPREIDPGRGLAALPGTVHVYVRPGIDTTAWREEEVGLNRDRMRAFYECWQAELETPAEAR